MIVIVLLQRTGHFTLSFYTYKNAIFNTKKGRENISLRLRGLDSQKDLWHENATKLDKTNIMTLVAMNDDKHNDVWVSCCHGNSTRFGMVSQTVLSL